MSLKLINIFLLTPKPLNSSVLTCLKEQFTQKINNLSSLTHPHVVPNLYKFLSHVEHKIRYFEQC